MDTRETVEACSDGNTSRNREVCDDANVKNCDGCDDITEEQENKLLSDDYEDLDVIDCYTEDFESDMEEDFCRKEARKAETSSNVQLVVKNDSNYLVDTTKSLFNKVNQEKEESQKNAVESSSKSIVITVKEPENVSNIPNIDQQTSSKDRITSIIREVVVEEDNDDEIQIDENIDPLLKDDKDVSDESEASQPDITVRVKDEKEQERILRKPLIKQIIIPEIIVSDDGDELSDDFGSQESLDLQIDHYVGKASELAIADKRLNVLDEDDQKDDVSETGIKIDFDPDSNEKGVGSCLSNCNTEDADIQQLQMEFYENEETIDNESEEKYISTTINKHAEKVKRGRKPPAAMEVIYIKEEPRTPVKERLEKLNIPENTIPTIDLTSSDEETTQDIKEMIIPAYWEPKTKKKSKKKKRNLEHNDFSLSNSLALVRPTLSERSIDSLKRTDSDAVSVTSFDDTLSNSDRIISLRKRMVTVLPETPPKIICHKKHKRVESISLKGITKRKKREDPYMRGYKRRKRTRSGSKSSIRSASTAPSSLIDDEIVKFDTIDEITDVNEQTNADFANLHIGDSDVKQEDKNGSLDSVQLKEAIAKELQSELTVEGQVKVNEEQNTSDVSLPEARTDIALEDMLEDFINREEEKKKNDIFCSITPEEKFIMESLFDDCNKQPQSNSIEVPGNGNPLFERPVMYTESDQITINYTISDCTSPISVVPISCQIDQESLNTNHFEKLTGPHFKIIQNYDRYKKLLQSRPSKPVKVIEPLPRPNRRKRAESDEEYRPNRYIKKRLFARPRKRVQTRVEGNNHFRPTGEYLAAGEVDVVYKNMPSLEEDLALTSSDSCSVENGTLGSSIYEQEKYDSQLQADNLGTIVENVGKTMVKEKKQASGKKGFKTGKRGRPPTKKSKICDFFCSTTGQQKASCNAPCCAYLRDAVSQPSLISKPIGKPNNNKEPKKRRKKHGISSFDNEAESFSGNPSPSTNTKSLDDLCSAPSAVLPDYAECELEENLQTNVQTGLMMDNLQVIISPLTDEKIRKINTPKKRPKGLTKACQTEIRGLTWSIELDKIDFCSEYFEKLRVLLNSGAARNALRRANDEGLLMSHSTVNVRSKAQDGFGNLDGVEIQRRGALQLALNSPASVPSSISLSDQVVQPTSHSRSSVEALLFQKGIGELEAPSTNTNVESSRKQLVKSIRSTFRIPKIVKQPSTSPQPVTSSTPSVMEAYFSKENEDQISVMQLPSSSRELNTDQAPETTALMSRPVEREYVDDETESYRSSNSSAQSYVREDPRRSVALPKRIDVVGTIKRNDSSSSRSSPLNFANALNFKYAQITESDDKRNTGPTAPTAPSSVPQVPIPLENRIVLPDRSEMMNVKRTIRNNISQSTVTSQVAQHPLQPAESLSQLQFPMGRPHHPPIPVEYKFNPQPLPVFHTFGAYGSNPSFNKGYQSNNDIDIKPLIPNMYSGWGNFGRNDVLNTGGQPGGINDFVAMLFEQYKQQQQCSGPPTAAIPTMPMNVVGANHLPMFGQWFPPPVAASMPSASAVKLQPTMLPVNSTTKPNHSSETVEMICYLLGCYDFFVDKCIKLHCRFSHVLPHEEEVLQKLSMQSCEFIMATYRFVNSRDDLFNKYFPVYAGVMGRNKMRHQLVGTIQDCEKPKRPLQYYRYIVEALKISGTSPAQAVQILIDKHRKTNFHQINILIELILETGESVPLFLRWLEDFLHVKGYSYEMSAINRLLVIAMEQTSRELAKFISKVVLKVADGDESLINTAMLLEFAQKVRQYPDMELDVEDIVKKYGKVVMRL